MKSTIRTLMAAILLSMMANPVMAGKTIDLRKYYPLQDGNEWTYQFRAIQSDGQVKYSIKRYTVAGDVELDNGEVVKKLEDQRGWYYLLSIEKDRYLHWGEHEDRGMVTNDPPFRFFDTSFTFGKSYSFAHAISDGSARGTDVVFDGYESINVSAGEFKNCLKSTFKYINPNGSTFQSTTWLAEGVGVVKKEFEIYSPKAGQTLHFDRELIHAVVNSQKVGGKKSPTVENLSEYFPYYQGDSWTYDWSYTMKDGTVRSEERTRSFMGGDFFDKIFAFKMVDNKGSYQFYSFSHEEGVRMHGSFENRPGGIVFTYEPVITLFRPDMVIGREYKWSEVEDEELQPKGIGRNKRMRHWTSEIERFQSLETPLGKFDDVLVERLSWTTSIAWVTQWYYFARNVGIVAIDYEAIDKKTGDRVIGLNARIIRAELQGDAVNSIKDLATHVKNVKKKKSKWKDDPKARKLFKAAFDNRYTWDEKFPGIKADIEISDHGGKVVNATIVVDKSLSIDFECDDCGGGLRSLARAQISQFVTHRNPEPFSDRYAKDIAYFTTVKKRRNGMVEIKADGDKAMGSWYLVDGKEIRKLNRTLGGPVKFTIHHEKNIITEDGRYIANYYPVKFFIEKDGRKKDLGEVVYDDVFVKQGPYWLPKHRILKGKLPQPDMSIIDVDLEVQFKNVTYLQ